MLNNLIFVNIIRYINNDKGYKSSKLLFSFV